ncbi:MAG: 16S rRNA processing protein RimM [Cryomorphaceae bacterium]|nr:MAG: 16S rRNA processing protein RimM [Cryomorphaceae bacterium]
MRKEDCFYIGLVSKTYSYRGELIFHLEVNNPADFQELESVFVERHDKLIPFFIEHMLFDRPGAYARVKLEGVDDEHTARSLIRCALYLPLSMKPEDEDPDEDPSVLIGYTVWDEELGDIGKVIDYYDHHVNPLIEVSGKRGKALIPLQDAFILEIDTDKEQLKVSIPEELFGLNP